MLLPPSVSKRKVKNSKGVRGGEVKRRQLRGGEVHGPKTMLAYLKVVVGGSREEGELKHWMVLRLGLSQKNIN